MRIRVLLVDDEKEFVQVVAERLTARDFDVTVSFSGEDAIAKLKEYNFDVAILDILMPGMNGIDALREIKRIKPLTEVILLTGHAAVDTAIDGMKLGAYDYLIKPCEFADLMDKIKKAYERKAEHDERIRAAKVQDIITSPRSVLDDD
jgi:DNA-binding NtrC family response regulator